MGKGELEMSESTAIGYFSNLKQALFNKKKSVESDESFELMEIRKRITILVVG